MRGRLEAHLAKVRVPADTQGRVFGAAGQLECSWVLNGGWYSHQRLELETDLIAAHVLATGDAPSAQFLG